MKNLVSYFFIASWLIVSCGNKNLPSPNSVTHLAPSNLTVKTTIASDSSGTVTITVSAMNAVSYDIDLGNGVIKTINSGSLTYTYPVTGNYTINVIAKSADGETLSQSAQVAVALKMKLIFADEFNAPGSPDPTKWGYDIGGNGWGNNELEYYTNRTSNVYISNGTLKIVAQKEAYMGNGYTSGRILTQNKFSFTYGKIEVRAKIPGNAGAWPAIWMLGSNISTVNWPTCGEIDIMENVGNQPNKIFGTVHFQGQPSGAGVGGTIILPSAYTDFHRYATVWTPTMVQFLIDDIPYFTYNNSSSSPFNKDFFIILNLALGGNFGGPLDPNFTTGQMEVDYVRVYQ